MATSPWEDALKRGLEMARDPLNARITDPTESRITTIYSPWLLQVCRICHHTFREGDLARPDPKRPGRMLHEDPRSGLCCWSRATGHTPDMPPGAAACSHEVREAFLRGLHQHWQPAGGTAAQLVVPGSPLIGRKCPVCRHTIRAGDQVVLCPCGRDCGGVFHQDITRHLTCWDTWNRGQPRSYCAFTGAPFHPHEEHTPQ